MKPYYEEDGITIYHGDCREILPELRADLVLTDPPYGMGRTYGPNYNDMREGYWKWFPAVVKMMRKAAPVVAFTHGFPALKNLTDWDWLIAWHKPIGSAVRIGNSPLLAHWEPILLWGIHSLGVRREALPDLITCDVERSPRRPISNSRRGADRDAQFGDHPFPKPLRLFHKLIAGLSNPGDIVIDNFCGSGTTLRAAKDLGRGAVGIEIEEEYCEIAAKRLSQRVLAFPASEASDGI